MKYMPLKTREIKVDNRINEVLKKLGFDKEWLGQVTGYKRQYISRIANKSVPNPGITACLLISRAVGKPVDYIFYIRN